MSDIELEEDEYGYYSIKNRIGKGAFGHVYRAIDNETGQQIALKVCYITV